MEILDLTHINKHLNACVDVPLKTVCVERLLCLFLLSKTYSFQSAEQCAMWGVGENKLSKHPSFGSSRATDGARMPLHVAALPLLPSGPTKLYILLVNSKWNNFKWGIETVPWNRLVAAFEFLQVEEVSWAILWVPAINTEHTKVALLPDAIWKKMGASASFGAAPSPSRNTN